MNRINYGADDFSNTWLSVIFPGGFFSATVKNEKFQHFLQTNNSNFIFGGK